MKKKYKNILVYSGGEAIGDALYKINFIKNLRYNFPDSKITWLAGQGKTEYSHSLKTIINQLIDEVIDNIKVGLNPILELIKTCPIDSKYDVIIDTQTVVLPTLIVKKIKHDIFLSASAKWLFSDLKPKDLSLKNYSLNDRLHTFIKLINNNKIKYDKNDIILENKYTHLANKLLPKGPTYVGIAPGAGDKSKIWPLDNFIKLAQKQVENNRIPVLFLGPEENDLLDIIKKEVPKALFPEWTDEAIESGIKGPILVIALAQQIHVAIANDSGTGHMFAVAGTKLISLFSKHNSVKYAPNAKNLVILDSKKWGGIDPNLIPFNEVNNSVNKLLG
jgi:ADP-heptose:LPS heptosyltransferase